MNSRERICKTLRHREPDQVPFDLSSTPVTGIHRVAYGNLRRAMGLLFAEMKLAVEPAGAAATAALLGPLRQRLQGKRVGVIVCGANIDFSTFAAQAVFE